MSTTGRTDDGFFDRAGDAVAVAGDVVAGPARFMFSVDREALRRAGRDARRAGDHLRGAAGKARSGLDTAAGRHPGFASSTVLTRFADSWRDRQRQVVDELEDFDGKLTWVRDGYQAVEDASSAIS